jgi:hypothetical protein
MTRQAFRKKRRDQTADRPPVPHRPAPAWTAMGAFVASAALASAQATPASAFELHGVPLNGRLRGLASSIGRAASPIDHRLAVLQDALRPRLPVRPGVGRVEGTQGGATTQEQRPRQFDIPAGPLDLVLTAFERLTGITVTVAMPEIRLIQSPGVSGAFTAGQALQALLTGTSVTFRSTGSTGVMLELQARSESVEVRGRVAEVVSPKYVVPLRDVAQTIALIPRTVIEEQGVTTLSEAMRNVPGITLQAGEGGGVMASSLATSSISSRSRCSWAPPAPTSGVARPPAT